MTEKVTGTQPSVLRWARESQGYSIEEVASRLKCDPSEVAAWETGAESPTYVQLETLAYKIYKRPLAVFFLPEPPAEPEPEHEFRTLPEYDLKASLLILGIKYGLLIHSSSRCANCHGCNY